MAILDINDADNVVAGLQKEYAQNIVIFLRTDVTVKEDIQKAFRQANDAFGSIDVVIGNAGIFDETKPEKVITVNLVWDCENLPSIVI